MRKSEQVNCEVADVLGRDLKSENSVTSTQEKKRKRSKPAPRRRTIV